jgi:hypothetical protein
MKITSEHLEQVRLALIERSTALSVKQKAAAEAIGARDETSAKVRGLQGAFDICAASYAQDSELSSGQLNDLPTAVQSILGFDPKASPAK